MNQYFHVAITYKCAVHSNTHRRSISPSQASSLHVPTYSTQNVFLSLLPAWPLYHEAGVLQVCPQIRRNWPLIGRMGTHQNIKLRFKITKKTLLSSQTRLPTKTPLHHQKSRLSDTLSIPILRKVERKSKVQESSHNWGNQRRQRIETQDKRSFAPIKLVQVDWLLDSNISPSRFCNFIFEQMVQQNWILKASNQVQIWRFHEVHGISEAFQVSQYHNAPTTRKDSLLCELRVKWQKHTLVWKHCGDWVASSSGEVRVQEGNVDKVAAFVWGTEEEIHVQVLYGGKLWIHWRVVQVRTLHFWTEI